MKIILCFLVFSFTAILGAEGVNWRGFNDGTAKAKAAKKPAIVDFYTDWCGWCKKMDADTYGDEKVRKLLKERFVAIKLNPEKSGEVIQYDGKMLKPAELIAGLGINGFPATAFMDTDGKFITVVPGYIPAETYYLLLKYVDGECYKMKVSFEEYQKNPAMCSPKKKGKIRD